MADEPKVDLKKLNLKKIPTWVWVAGAGGAVILVFIIIRNNAASAATPATGGSSDALAALGGFTQQLDQIKSGLQAEIDALSADQKTNIKQLADSINVSILDITTKIGVINADITKLTAGQASLTAGQTALQTALDAAKAQIAAIASQTSANNTDIYSKFSAYNQIIQDLRDQLTRFAPTDAVAQMFDTARTSLAALYGTRGQPPGGFNVNAASSVLFMNIDQVIATLKSDGSLLAGTPARAFLLSLVRDANGIWTLPATAGKPALPPLPLPTPRPPPHP